VKLTIFTFSRETTPPIGRINGFPHRGGHTTWIHLLKGTPLALCGGRGAQARDCSGRETQCWVVLQESGTHGFRKAYPTVILFSGFFGICSTAGCCLTALTVTSETISSYKIAFKSSAELSLGFARPTIH
jgi:hypothetical protein